MVSGDVIQNLANKSFIAIFFIKVILLLKRRNTSKMSTHHEDTPISNIKKGKRKAQNCDLKGQDDIVCNYEQHVESIIYEQIDIPSSSQYLNLVGKALCRKHYNKLIVNARKKSKTNKCLHPKYTFYISTARNGIKGKKLKKASEQLIRFFKLSQRAMICHHCLYKTDDDLKYVNSPDYLSPPERISRRDIRKFQKRSYMLRSD